MMEMKLRRKLMTFAIVLSLVLAALSAVWFAQPARAYAAVPDALSGKVTNLEDLMVNKKSLEDGTTITNVKSNFTNPATDNNIILPLQTGSKQACLEIKGPYTDKAVKFRFIATSDLSLAVLSRATGTVSLDSWTASDAYIVQIALTRADLYGFGHGKNGAVRTYTSLTVGDTYTVTYGTYDDGDNVKAYFCLESAQAVIVEYTHTYSDTAAVKTGGNFRILNNVKSNVKILGAEGTAMKSQEKYSFEGFVWNNRSADADVNRELLIAFRRSVFDIEAKVNKTNWLADENSQASKKIKLNGVALGELYKADSNYTVRYDQGANYIYVKYPASAAVPAAGYPYATLAIEDGMQFYFGSVAATTIYLDDGIWSNVQPATPQDVTFTGYADTYGWNNQKGTETLLTFSSTGFQKKDATNLVAKATSDAATKMKINGKTLGAWYSEDSANITVSTAHNQSYLFIKYKPAILATTTEYPITTLEILPGTKIHYGIIKDGLTLYLVHGFWTKDKPETVSDEFLNTYSKYTISDITAGEATTVELKGSAGANAEWADSQLQGALSSVVVTDIKFSDVTGQNKPSPRFMFRGKNAGGWNGISFYLAASYRAGSYTFAMARIANETGASSITLYAHPFEIENNETYRFEMGVIELKAGTGIYVYLKIDGKLLIAGTVDMTIPEGGEYFGAFSQSGGIDIKMSSIDEQAPVINYSGKTAIKKVKNTDKLTFDVSVTDYTGIKFAKATAEAVTPLITWSDGALDGSDKLLTGTHTVTITATDAAGNEAEPVVITVTVVDADTEAPVITYSGSLTLNLDKGDAKPVITASAADDIDDTAIVNIVYSDGMLDGNDKLLVGTHTITISASDAAGNAATDKVITVVVAETDLTAPVIDYAGKLTLNLKTGDKKPVITAEANDAVDGKVDVVVSYSEGMLDSAGNVLEGTHTITLSAQDSVGNIAQEIVITVVVTPVETGKTGCGGSSGSVSDNLFPLALVCVLLSCLFIFRKKSLSKK